MLDAGALALQIAIYSVANRCNVFSNVSRKSVVKCTTNDNWLLIAASRYADVLIDVGHILRELAISAGCVCEAVTPIRAMKTSAQQGWQASLSEDLVRLRPA